jgi:hypothetical protein
MVATSVNPLTGKEYHFMEKFWSWFWKLFAAAIAVALVVSIILGIAQGSFNILYDVAQKIIIVAIGICGVIGFVVVPVELYITDRINRAKNKDDGEVPPRSRRKQPE